MSTSSPTTSGQITCVVNWHESVTDTTFTYAPEVIATSSASVGDPSIPYSWDLTVDGVSVSSGSGNTDYYGYGTGRGPYTVDTFVSRSVTRTYGSTHTIRLQENFTDWYGAGSSKRLNLDKTITVPARPYDLPAAPTSVTATRVTDSQVTLAWTNNATTAAPYDLIGIERSVNGGAWVQLASVAGNATGYTDTGTAADNSYSYRLNAQNSTGPGSYSATAGPVVMTPAAPGTPVASKVSTTSIRLTMTNTSKVATALEVDRSTDGGSTWTSLADGSGLVTVYTDTAAPAASSVIYRVRNTNGTLTSAWSANSNAIAVLAEPYAPTILTAANAPMTQGDPARLSWRFNPSDGSSQTKYQVRISTDGGGTWTTLTAVTSSNEYYDLATGTYSDGDVITWQVKTWGLYTDPSPWSSNGSIVIYDAPTVTMTAPATDPYSLTSLPLTTTWTFSDGARVQSRANATITDSDSAVVATQTIYGTATSITLDGWQPANLSSYTLTLTVTSSSGLAVALTCTIDVNYNAPAIPSADIVESDGKSLTITVHEGIPSGGELATDSLAVYRVYDGVQTLLADGLSDGDTVIDYLPPMDDEVIYRIVALSSTNLTSTKDEPYTLASHGWLVLNFGSGWSDAVAIKYDVKYSESFEDDGELWYGAGSPDPVLIIGAQRSKAMSASGSVVASDLPALRSYADGWHRPSYVRAPGGLKAKVRVTVSIDTPHTKYANVQLDMRRLA